MSVIADLKVSYRARVTALAERAAEIALEETLDETPVKTGDLRRVTGTRRISNTETEIVHDIYANADYASYVDQGTRGPYRIFPKNARALRFMMGGRVVFAKSVVHPGIRAQHFFKKPMPKRWRNAIEQAANEVQL